MTYGQKLNEEGRKKTREMHRRRRKHYILAIVWGFAGGLAGAVIVGLIRLYVLTSG